MHIVQLANFYGPQSGGIRVCLDQLSAQYGARGHRTSLIIPGRQDSVEIEQQPLPDGRVHERTVVRVRAPFVPGLGGYRGILDVPKVLRRLDDLCPDVIELSDKTSLAVPAARFRRQRGTPVVAISHERVDAVFTNTLADRRFIRSGVWRYNQGWLRHVDAVVCASRFAADEFRSATPSQRLRLFKVPLGVDLNTFRPSTRPPDDGPLRMVVVVRQSPEKDPWLIPATIRSLVRRGVDVQATVYGDGPLREAMAVDSADLPLIYAGHTNGRSELAERIGEAHIACAPGPNETFGLGALEVLACGTPLVVPERGALRELVTTDCGRIARSTGRDFADAVIDLWEHDQTSLREAARRRAEEFTWGRTGLKFLELFGDLIDDRRQDLSEDESVARTFVSA